MNPFYILIGILVLTKKIVDLVFSGIAAAFSASASPAPTKLLDKDIEIYEPEQEDTDAS